MNLPGIHLCIVQPVGYVHSLGFLDQARFLRHQFRRLGAVVSLAKNRLRHDAVNIGFGILFDLKGATQNTVLPSLACRPAPLQLTWQGFPGTTGAPCIDYLIGDEMVTPLAPLAPLAQSAHFAETIAQLPHRYQPNDAQRTRPLTAKRSECGVLQDKLRLCAFHPSCKISAKVFDTWLLGKTFARRVAASLLHAFGADELVCHSGDAYRAQVLALAEASPCRQALREHLLAQQHNALFDDRRMARDLGALWTRMWQRAVDGLPPEALPAQPA